MQTVEEIMAYLQAELEEAYEMHDQANGKDAQQALFYMLKASILTHIIEEINE